MASRELPFQIRLVRADPWVGRDGASPDIHNDTSMRDHLLQFVGVLRQRGITISVAESLDALHAVGMVGVKREPLRETLATCLIKDEADRLLFDELFDEHFPLIGRRLHRGRRGSRVGDAGGEGTCGTKGSGQSAAVLSRFVESGQSGNDEVSSRLQAKNRAPNSPRGPGAVRVHRDNRDTPRDPRHPPAEECKEEETLVAIDAVLDQRTSSMRSSDQVDRERESPAVGHRRRQRELLRKPFREYTPDDVEASDTLVELLARQLRGRLARRHRVSRRGRLDIRRTLRRATSSGGVPVRLLFRGPRPDRPRLVALCDVSGSVSAVSSYLLGLIEPAARFFRSVETFVYVDHLCPVSFEKGHLVPQGPLDFYAPSDFGQVLVEYCAGPVNRLDRNSVFLVLGDARNNRRPPRARLLANVRGRARAVYWLNPEVAARWNTGDSVIGQYTRHCTAVLECFNLSALVEALGRSL